MLAIEARLLSCYKSGPIEIERNMLGIEAELRIC